MAAGHARSADFISTLRFDLYPEEVYAFTPQGKVIVLLANASPIDFAYRPCTPCRQRVPLAQKSQRAHRSPALRAP